MPQRSSNQTEIERDLLAEPPALRIAPEQVVGDDRERGAEEKFEHRIMPSAQEAG